MRPIRSTAVNKTLAKVRLDEPSALNTAAKTLIATKNQISKANERSSQALLTSKRVETSSSISNTISVDDIETVQNSNSSSLELNTEVSEPIAIADDGDLQHIYYCGTTPGNKDKSFSIKPKGSARVNTQVQVANTTLIGFASVCVDTGADLSICTDTFLKYALTTKSLEYIVEPLKKPKLQSASGHAIKVLGNIRLILYLGTFRLDLWVAVQESSQINFLLGSDAFYGRLIFDRGKYLAFAEKGHKPVPISYKLTCGIVRADSEWLIAPSSVSTMQARVTTDSQVVGKSVFVKQADNFMSDNCNKLAILDTVSEIDSDGMISVVVMNNSEEMVSVPLGVEIAQAELIQDEDLSPDEDQDEIFSIYEDREPPEMKEWVKRALNPGLLERLPDCLKLRQENLPQEFLNGLPEGYVRFLCDKKEIANFVDGIGEGFPTPSSAELYDLPEGEDEWLKNVDYSHLNARQTTKLQALLVQYKEAFARSKTDLGCCKYFKASLPLKPGTGWLHNKPRQLPHKHKEAAQKVIDTLLAQGVIRPSKSPHATNIVVVTKKAINGETQYRVCVDLRQVNEHSIPNRFPNYSIEQAMSKVQGAALRTSLDLSSAFHQVLLEEDSIPVTAFYFDNMLYEYVRLPFGHVQSMSCFCAVMSLLCEGYEFASFYADDLIITTPVDPTASSDEIFDRHLEHVGGMLQRMIDAGLKLNAHKCYWMYGADKPMDWLGFTIQNNLLKPQEAKVKAVNEFPVPTSAKQALSFVSLAAFYRRFIKSFAKIAAPIYNVVKAETFQWTAEANSAFLQLKEILKSEPVLKLPRAGEPFIIYSDASHGAIGVVLCQISPIDGLEHPCAYGSRKFNTAELKMSTPCKELLAILYGLSLWKFYLCGTPVTIKSDCRAWTFLKVQSGVSGKVSRYSLMLASYDCSIEYVPGVKNKAADALSRAWDDGKVSCDDLISNRHPALEHLPALPLKEGQVVGLNDYMEMCSEYVKEVWPKILKDVEPSIAKVEPAYAEKVLRISQILSIDTWQDSLYDKTSTTFKPLIKEEWDSRHESCESVISEDTSVFGEAFTTNSTERQLLYSIRMVAMYDPYFTVEAFEQLQKDDKFCKKVIRKLNEKDEKYHSLGFFVHEKGLLMRRRVKKDGQIYDVLCIPASMVQSLLNSTHHLPANHHGSQKYLLDMGRRYFWPKMSAEIIRFQQSCIACRYNDRYPVKHQLGRVMIPLHPMHIVHCDLVVGLPKAFNGCYCILLFYDGFSRFTFGLPLKSEKADHVVAQAMIFISAFGTPTFLHSDNGKNIDGKLMRHLAAMLGIHKTSTPPYTPNANPCETMCGAVSMLLTKALIGRDQKYWPLCLPLVLNALNSTVHTSTGYTPNSLFSGRYQDRPLVPLLPYDSESVNVNEYFQKMRKFQDVAFQIARIRTKRQIESKKLVFDKTARKPKYCEGDYVLVKNLSPGKGPGQLKLRAKYLGPYRIIKVYPSSLIVIPWSEGKLFEKYKSDPRVLNIFGKGQIRAFHPQIVSIKHCKPFRKLSSNEHIVDPLVLKDFLDQVDISWDQETLSVLESKSQVSDRLSRSTLSTQGSDGSDPDSDGAPPDPPLDHPHGDDGFIAGDDIDVIDPDEPDEPPDPNIETSDEGVDSHPSSLLWNFEANWDDLKLLRAHLIPDDQLSQASTPRRHMHERIIELLQAARSHEWEVRDDANRELGILIDELRGNNADHPVGPPSVASDASINQRIVDDFEDENAQEEPVPEQVQVNIEPPDGAGVEENNLLDDLINNEPLGAGYVTPPQVERDQDIHIRTPNFTITVSNSRPGAPSVIRRDLTSEVDVEGAAYTTPLSNSSRQLFGDNPNANSRNSGYVTRSGRTSRPAERFDANQEERSFPGLAKTMASSLSYSTRKRSSVERNTSGPQDLRPEPPNENVTHSGRTPRGHSRSRIFIPEFARPPSNVSNPGPREEEIPQPELEEEPGQPEGATGSPEESW